MYFYTTEKWDNATWGYVYNQELENNDVIVYAKTYNLADTIAPTWINLGLDLDNYSTFGDSVATLTVTDNDRNSWITAKSTMLAQKVNEAKDAGKKLCLILKHAENVMISEGYAIDFHNSNNAGGNVPRLNILRIATTVSATDNFDLDKENDFTLFPNPATNFVRLSSPVEIVNIFNVNGQLVKSVNGNVQLINVENLQKGFYLVEVNTGKEKQIKRMLIR